MGLSLGDLLTSHALELAKEMLRQELLIEKGEQKDLSKSKASELEMVCKDGSTFWGETRMSFLREPDGEPVGILGVVRDITRAGRRKRPCAYILRAPRMSSILSPRTLLSWMCPPRLKGHWDTRLRNW